MVIATNFKIARLPYIDGFLADWPTAIVGWGRKPSGMRALRWSHWLRRPVALLEDGFVRSFHRQDPPLSLIIDHCGVYYDASLPSDLETAVAGGIDARAAKRARALIKQWQSSGISKYNHSPDFADSLPESYVLVVDQTFGDLSVSLGLANQSSFAAMLAAALVENPDKAIVIKTHPDIFSHGARGWLPINSQTDHQITVIGKDCHAASLLRSASKVYAVTSLMGFEALLWGKPVRCFGMPFYAGWGLTEDELSPPSRRGAASLEGLVHAAFVVQSRYVDPASGTPWQVEQAIAYVAKRRRAHYSAIIK